MTISKTLSALAILAILAPMPAAASGLTPIDQGRSARRSTETLRERVAERPAQRREIAAERRQTQLKRAEALRSDQRERKLSSERMHRQLQLRLRAMKRRMAHRRAIRRF